MCNCACPFKNPVPVAVNIVPISLSAAPTVVKSELLGDVITYSVPVTRSAIDTLFTELSLNFYISLVLPINIFCYKSLKLKFISTSYGFLFCSNTLADLLPFKIIL